MFIVDTGSSISLIQQGVCSSKVRPTDLIPFGVTGKEREMRGTQDVKFWLNNREFSHQFCVCSLPTDADGIIAMDFLSERNASENLKSLELRLSKHTCFKQRFQSESETSQRTG